MIERLYVHNYRCFENFTLDLKGKSSALVIGRNGAGKSTLGNVLGIFQNVIRGTKRVKEYLDLGDFSHGRREVPIRIEIDVMLGERRFEYKLSFEASEKYGDVRVSEEWLAIQNTVVFTRVGASTTLGAGGTFGIDIPGAILTVARFPQDAEVRQFKAFISSLLLLSPIPATMMSYAEEETFELLPDASNFVAWLGANLTRSPSRYAAFEKYLLGVMPDYESFVRSPVGEKGTKLLVHFQHVTTGDRPREPLDFRKFSDGEKCFFLCAAVVAFNRPENPLFCFWDEPDNHLSLPEVGQFVTELRKSTSRHGQFIATSHHPETIRRFSDENTFVFTRNSHLEPTVVRPLTELPYGTDLVRALVRGEVI